MNDDYEIISFIVELENSNLKKKALDCSPNLKFHVSPPSLNDY